MKLGYIALGLLCSGSALAADTITATHVFPARLVYSRSFLEFVKKANEAGKANSRSRCAADRKPSR